MVTMEEFDFMMKCWKTVNEKKHKVAINSINKAIDIAERIIYKKEQCSKQLDGIQKRTILVDLNRAKG